MYKKMKLTDDEIRNLLESSGNEFSGELYESSSSETEDVVMEIPDQVVSDSSELDESEQDTHKEWTKNYLTKSSGRNKYLKDLARELCDLNMKRHAQNAVGLHSKYTTALSTFGYECNQNQGAVSRGNNVMEPRWKVTRAAVHNLPKKGHCYLCTRSKDHSSGYDEISTKLIKELPKAVYLLIGAEFCERFSFCGIRTILSLYLRNNLLFDENTSTVIYHVFIMLCYVVPLVGAILADSFLGRYKTILYFSLIYTAGNILLCLAAIPPISLPPVSCSLIGLLLVAVGSGGIKPCVAAFGGDQFHLPEEEELLDKFFSYFYFSINFGGFIGMIFTPILRKSFMCFGDDQCYAVGFGFPALLVILSLYLYVFGKDLFRIRCPKENIILKFICCTYYAVKRRLESKVLYTDHWLDAAIEKYSEKLIDDMKIVFGIFFLFIPVPLFWSLFDQQGSRWTFQASRMRGDFLGMQLIPDQMQVLNPAIVLVLIPLFDRSIYPVIGYNNTVSSLLTKMFAGGIIASFAFITSGAIEIKLEESYPVLPEKDSTHLNFINTVPCRIEIVNPFNGLQIVNGSSNFVFKNVNIKNITAYDFMVFAPSECSHLLITQQQLYINVLTSEQQVEEIIICAVNSQLMAYVTQFEDLNKTLSGKSKIRYSSEYMDLQYRMIKNHLHKRQECASKFSSCIQRRYWHSGS
ncbi:peptide transporter family 1-like [Schistocerca serialis cubense]|uniref:peptide transporter family 1-like n=1 Tax=Schistocerca serialis cubense TaxID=2023355 RepID=UPI00214E07A5|nr:peptide transporter family 1-like [Schistocerca serialis cubense]